jgi:hypothetical protein
MTAAQLARLEAIEQQADAVALQADALRQQVAGLRLELTTTGPVEPDLNLPDGAGLRERFINGDDGHGSGTGPRGREGPPARAPQGAGRRR